MEFSAVQLLVTAVTGGLLGGFIQQFIQLRMAKMQRRTEDERRAEDRRHLLEDRRAAQREALYLELLRALARYSSALASLEGVLARWVDLTAMLEAHADAETRASIRGTAAAILFRSDVEDALDTYGRARDDVVDAVNSAAPIASSAARDLFDGLELEPRVALLRRRMLDPALFDDSVPAHDFGGKSSFVERLTDGPSAIKLVDRLRDLCVELDSQLRRELALD